MQKVNYVGLDLDTLLVLQSLCDTRNTKRTAERLNMSQPGVSRKLDQLRSVLGDPLLVRASDGMVLTELALALRGSLESLITQLTALLAPYFRGGLPYHHRLRRARHIADPQGASVRPSTGHSA